MAINKDLNNLADAALLEKIDKLFEANIGEYVALPQVSWSVQYDVALIELTGRSCSWLAISLGTCVVPWCGSRLTGSVAGRALFLRA